MIPIKEFETKQQHGRLGNQLLIWDKYILQFETNTLVASELRAELLPFLFHIYSQMHIATAAAINNKLRQFLSFPHCYFFFNFNPSRIVCYLSNRSLLLRYKGKERESVIEWQWPTLSHNFYKDAKTMAHKYQGRGGWRRRQNNKTIVDW